MGPKTAKSGILKALRKAPAGACVTRTELIKSSGRANETARAALTSLQKDGVIEEAPLDGVRAYRMSKDDVVDVSPRSVPQVEDTEGDDELCLLRSLIESKLKLEFKIVEIERSIRDKLGQSW